jgi:nitrate/nitrite transporter NarK
VFAVVVFIFGCGMGAGKASVYRYVYDYFPRDVGAVGGLVGQLGALGGFVFPPIWAYALWATGIPETTWLVLLAITVSCYIWQLIAGRTEREPATREERLAEAGDKRRAFGRSSAKS